MSKRSVNLELSRKKMILIILIIIPFCTICYADTAITRGPNVGEIYFLGPTMSSPDASIYLSTDFGESAGCVYIIV